MAEQPNKVLGVDNLNTRAHFLSNARRVFIDALQTFFSTDEMFGEPNPYQWLPNTDPNSKIVIAAEYTEEQTVPTAAHMILVNRGPVRFQKLSIANANQFIANPFRNPLPAGRTYKGHKYSALAQLDMQIECYSRLPAEVERIALAVSVCVLSFQKHIRERGNFHRIDNPIIGNEVPINSSDSKIMMTVVPVTVPVLINMTWETKAEPFLMAVEPIIDVEDC